MRANFPIELEQLQETDHIQVGTQLLRLSHLLKAGYPVLDGWIVSDAIMREAWSQIHWPNEILQDFPYLNLNFSLSQAAQAQFMAQMLQQGILDNLPLPSEWASSWEEKLNPFKDGDAFALTPYVWTDSDPLKSDATLASMVMVNSLTCSAQPEVVWQNLKTLWASLFQVQNLYVLQHLGLRPEQVHLSVLIQPIPNIKASGWMQLTADRILVQAQLGFTQEPWQAETELECYVYERSTIPPPIEPESGLISPVLRQLLLTLSQHIEEDSGLTRPTLTWVIVPRQESTAAKTSEKPHSSLHSPPSFLTYSSDGHEREERADPISSPEYVLQTRFARGNLGGECNVSATVQTISEPSHDFCLKLLGLAADLPMPMAVPKSRRSLSPQRSPHVEPPVPQSQYAQSQPAQSQWLGSGVPASPGRLTAPVNVVTNFQEIAPETLRGSILVISHLDPIHLPWLKFAAGLICSTGGLTSHGAIMARELGIPALMNVPEILTTIKTGTWVVLDGDRGEVWSASLSDGQAESLNGGIRNRLDRTEKSPHKTETLHTQTKVLINLSQPHLLNRALGSEPDGIGLVRGEWLFLDSLNRDPSWNWNDLTAFQFQLRKTLAQMLKEIAPYPVYYRAIDLQSPDLPGIGESDPVTDRSAHNPALGLRGTLRTLQDGRLFSMELSVLKDLLQDGAENLRLVLPFVRSPQEVSCCIEMMKATGIVPGVDLPLWIMAEVPSILFSLDQYSQMGIQGIAIGMNDLAQLLFGIDRDHPAFETTMRDNSTVLRSAVLQLVQRATALHLDSLLYGFTPDSKTEAGLAPLIQAGLTGVSVDLEAVAETRLAIAQIEQRLGLQQNRDDPVVEIS